MLRVKRASSATKMGAKLATVTGEMGSFVLVEDLFDGPLDESGLMIEDILLTVDDHSVQTLAQFNSIVEGKTEMDIVVKRMSQRQGGEGRRENKLYTINITISDQLGLGLNLKQIESGFENDSSNTFLYVKELLEYPGGDPGPGLTAGVRHFDLVLKINDMTVHTLADAKRAIEGQKTAKCEVRRMIRYHPTQHAEAHEIDIVVTRAAGESLGLALSETYGADSTGPFLVVNKVRGGGAGERADIRVHDIVCRAQGQDIHHLDDLKKLIGGLEKFELTLRRQT